MPESQSIDDLDDPCPDTERALPPLHQALALLNQTIDTLDVDEVLVLVRIAERLNGVREGLRSEAK